MARLYLRKTDPEKLQENQRLPYFTLLLIPEEEGGDWKEIGAFWKARNGVGYSGKTNEGVELDASLVNPPPRASNGDGYQNPPVQNQGYQTPPAQPGHGLQQQAPAPQPNYQTRRPAYPDADIGPDDIPFPD